MEEGARAPGGGHAQPGATSQDWTPQVLRLSPDCPTEGSRGQRWEPVRSPASSQGQGAACRRRGGSPGV